MKSTILFAFALPFAGDVHAQQSAETTGGKVEPTNAKEAAEQEPADNSAPTWLMFTLPPAFLLLFPLIWCFVCLILARVGGWRKLARHYGTDLSPQGARLSWQSGKLNAVSYNNCLTIDISENGIYLSIMVLFRPGHQPLLIPWSDIHDMRQDSFLWMKYTSLDVGEPKIATVKLSPDVHQVALEIVGSDTHE